LNHARRSFIRSGLVGGSALFAGIRPFAAFAAPFSSKVSLASHPISMISAPYFLGLAEGIWTKHDWNITELVPAAAGGAAVRTVATGGIPIGEVSATAAFQAWSVGAPIRLLSLGTDKPTELVYVAKPGTKITGPQDLAGKKVGFTQPGSGTHAAGMLTLDRLGLVGKTELVSTGGIREGLALLERGEIDVAPQLEALTKPTDKFQIVFRVPDFVPKYAYSAVIASDAFVQKEPQRIADFFKARSEAIARVKAAPDAAAAAWQKATKGLELESLKRTINAINAAQGWITTGWDVEAVQASLRSMELVGSIPSAKSVPLAEMLDQTFIDPENRIKL
jgi:ABC-type nitrate/sulfonate/bicarbonate transport system substrate-binding protein